MGRINSGWRYVDYPGRRFALAGLFFFGAFSPLNQCASDYQERRAQMKVDQEQILPRVKKSLF
jgi:hypothetical protein